MASEKNMSNLPWKVRELAWLGTHHQIAANLDTEIVEELDAAQVAVVALCPEGAFDKVRISTSVQLAKFQRTVLGLVDDPKLSSADKALSKLPWHNNVDGYQRVSALLHRDGALFPLKVVKDRYVPMQNIEIISDAKYLEQLSGGKTELVSGTLSETKAVIALNLAYEDAEVEIEGQKKSFSQAVTLYTSHDSSLAYAIAFSIAPAGSEYITYWKATKHKNTKGMDQYRDQLRFDLVDLENDGKKFIKEVELLGSIPLSVGSAGLKDAINLVVQAAKPPKAQSWFESWVAGKLEKAFEATATVYGFNALSFYLAANEWVLTKKRNNKHFIAVMDLSVSDFKVQSQLKQLLFSQYKGK
jgi:hypothetical protein